MNTNTWEKAMISDSHTTAEQQQPKKPNKRNKRAKSERKGEKNKARETKNRKTTLETPNLQIL
jgi:hypothetical protein